MTDKSKDLDNQARFRQATTEILRHQMMATDEVASVFRVHRTTVTHWAHAGKLPKHFYVGRKMMFRRDEIERYVAEMGKKNQETTETKPEPKEEPTDRAAARAALTDAHKYPAGAGGFLVTKPDVWNGASATENKRFTLGQTEFIDKEVKSMGGNRYAQMAGRVDCPTRDARASLRPVASLTMVRLTQDQLSRLDRVAESYGASRRELLACIVDDFLSQHD